MNKQIKNIDWLGPCSCGNKNLKVETDRTDCLLNGLDKVSCDCGMTGYIDVYGGAAFACWDELSEDEIKYNKLKIMYNKLLYLTMESNYGDERYLRSCGAIE